MQFDKHHGNTQYREGGVWKTIATSSASGVQKVLVGLSAVGIRGVSVLGADSPASRTARGA